MYEYIKGSLIEKTPQKAVVEAAGIGYRLSIGLNTYTALPHLGTSVELYLSQVIREDSNTLYAFLEKDQRDLFELLITLSGIGPKTALAIIGHLDLNSFQRAIHTADIRLLSKIPGVGKKTAERLIIEMKDKFKQIKKEVYAPISGSDSMISDALSALLNLGYNPLEAQRALEKAKEEMKEEKDLGKMISIALQKI